MNRIQRKSYLFSLLLSTVFFVSLALTGCGGSSSDGPGRTGEVYTNKNLPAKTTVEIPKSLTASSSGTKSYAKSLSIAESSKVPGPATPMGYVMLKSLITQVKEFSGDLEFEFLFIDVALSGFLSSQPAEFDKEIKEGDFTITFSQDLYNKLNEIYIKQGTPEAERDYPPIGEKIDCPAMKVKRESNPADGYNYTITYFDESPEEGYKGTYTIKWNTARNKIKVSDYFTITEGTNTYEGYTISILDNSGAKPLLTMQSTFKHGTEEMKYGLKLQETGKNNGVLIEASMTSNGMNCTIAGSADDNGGYIIATSTSGEYKFEYKESFNSTGQLTGCQISINGTPQPVEGYNAPSEGTYYAEYQSTGSLDSVELDITGVAKTEGVYYIIMPAGTTTAPATDQEKNAFYDKALGSAVCVSGTWEIDFWGSDTQISNAVMFKITYDADGKPELSLDNSAKLVTKTK